ncbi:MAG: hypothetical protein ACE37B_06155 [Ilumatobacter sp.]
MSLREVASLAAAAERADGAASGNACVSGGYLAAWAAAVRNP